MDFDFCFAPLFQLETLFLRSDNVEQIYRNFSTEEQVFVAENVIALNAGFVWFRKRENNIPSIDMIMKINRLKNKMNNYSFYFFENYVD